MESVIKGFVGLFCMVAVVVLGYGVVSMAMSNRMADTYIDDCVNKIENSMYSDAVITECKEAAKERGYDLDVNIYRRGDIDTLRYGLIKMEYHNAYDLFDGNRTYMVSRNIY